MSLFETERLVARRLVAEDAAAMAAIYGDSEAMKYVGDSRPLTPEICAHWVDVTNRNFERRGYGMIALIRKTDGAMVACAGIVHPDQQEEPEVKYALRRDAWGAGYATEAVCGLVRYAEEHLALRWMQSTVHPDHAASQRVLSKASFHHTRDRENEDGSFTQIWEWSASNPES
ncbi:MAG: GNAT family N-acetyltransferase [Fimbriimonas sp.]|nr:GNAT family N-acetyltransferase [Fimbriimonas sp.]